MPIRASWTLTACLPPPRYYVQTLPEDPAKRHVFRVEVPGEDNNQVAPRGAPACLTCGIKSPEGNDCTYADGSLSTSFTFAALYCLGPDPAFYGLYDVQQAAVGVTSPGQWWRRSAPACQTAPSVRRSRSTS